MFATFDDLHAVLEQRSEAERIAGAEMFLSRPDRWYLDPLWRCINDHISSRYLKSEAKGGALCLECREFVALTFPEDVEGPLHV